ncbi:MAG: thioredoxin-like domain-containing protein [Acidimicrobiales bacterium]
MEGRDWLTCDPIGWDELRGRAVVVVFWSYGCEASLVRLRQMAEIAGSVEAPITVIGVHTPRFPYEEHLHQLTSAVAQHHMAVPIVNDPEYITWNRYNPEGWPATVVIDARGRVLGSQVGTDRLDVITEALGLALQTTGAVGAIERSREVGAVPVAHPLPLPTEGLAYPTSVAVRPGGDLVVADSANDRLLVFELGHDLREATAVAEIDGFDHPTGVVADGQGIYVCEPTHGRVSHLDLVGRNRRLLTDDLVAPTSSVLDVDGSLVVADSGAEKLYRIVLNGPHAATMGLIAGTGVTGAGDGPAGEADLAQPTGLARTEVGLVFCDAASSNIRLLTDAGKVATITGNGFFDWGLVDGPAHKAMLQRPSDLAVLDDGSIIIVDTGNNRLRRLASRRIRTLGLNGLNRPSGVCALPTGHLVVADTGNCRLVVVEPDLHTAWTLQLRGILPPPRVGAALSSPAV